MDGFFNSLVYSSVLPCNGVDIVEDHESTREQDLATLSAQNVDLMSCDDVKLDAIWSERSPGGATVVVFHSNATVLHHMVDLAAWYRERGLNVLLLTIRGYQGSAGDAHADGELGLYKDVHAAVRFVFEQGVSADRVLLHGVSLGASLALDGAQRYGLRACVDQGFSTLSEVGSRLMGGANVDGMLKAAYPIGLEHKFTEHQQIAGCEKLVSDCFNNVAKISACAQNCFIICAADDQMAPRSDAEALYAAKYSDLDPQLKARYFVERPGKHMEAFTNYPSAAQALESYLQCEGLIS